MLKMNGIKCKKAGRHKVSSISPSDFYLIEDITQNNIETRGRYQEQSLNSDLSKTDAAPENADAPKTASPRETQIEKNETLAHEIAPLSFVYSNTKYFEKRIQSTSPISFNFAALIFGPLYAAARKMSFRGIFYFILAYVVALISFTQNWDLLVYNALELGNVFDNYETAILLINALPLAFIHIWISLRINVWYRKKCQKLVMNAKRLVTEKQQRYIKSKRGTSLVRPVIVLVLIYFIVINTELFLNPGAILNVMSGLFS